MNKQKGISQIVVMVIMLVLAIALPVTTKLVQKSQENRSKAAGYSVGQVCNSYGIFGCSIDNKQSLVCEHGIGGGFTWQVYSTCPYGCGTNGRCNDSTIYDGRGPGAELCTAKVVDGIKGQCQTTSSNTLPKTDDPCTVDGKQGKYFANLCDGQYNDNYRCCVPNIGTQPEGGCTSSELCSGLGVVTGQICNTTESWCVGGTPYKCSANKAVIINYTGTSPICDGNRWMGHDGKCVLQGSCINSGEECNGTIKTGLCLSPGSFVGKTCCVRNGTPTPTPTTGYIVGNTCFTLGEYGCSTDNTKSLICVGNVTQYLWKIQTECPYGCGTNGKCNIAPTTGCTSYTTSTACKAASCAWYNTSNRIGCFDFGNDDGCTNLDTSTTAASCKTNGTCTGTTKAGLCLSSDSFYGKTCCLETKAPATTNTPIPTAIPTVRPTNTPVPTAIPTVRPTNTPIPTAIPTQTPECTDGTKECTSVSALRICNNGFWGDPIACGAATPLCNNGVCEARALVDSTFSIKMSFAGVKPGNDQCVTTIWPVTLKVVDAEGSNVLDITEIQGVPQKTTEINSKGEIIYNLTGTISDVPDTGANNLAFFIKGPKHLSLKYGINEQSSWYNAFAGQLGLEVGSNNYDFSTYSLLAGDVTGNQIGVPDGKIDGRDYSFIKERSQPITDGEDGVSLVGDIDGNCQVNAGDVRLIKEALVEINSQIY